MTKRVLIVTGEISGDQHAAKLVSEVRKLDPSIQFMGMGGDKMRQAGVEIVVDSGPLAVVGLVEILQHAYPIYQAWKVLTKLIRNNPPDLLVLIDYPKFNLMLAKVAKKVGVKVLYYISPQIWAWHQSRVKIIRERVDKMLVLFPFEEEFYARAGVPVKFVGHPLAGQVLPSMDKVAAREFLNISTKGKIIGLLPGSRKGEIQRLLPTMLVAARELKQKFPDVEFILPLAASLQLSDITHYLGEVPNLPIHIVREQLYNALQLCDAAMVTSGTVTLEVALLGVPLVIVYKMAPFSYQIARRLVKVPHIGLCNIVAGIVVARELIQDAAKPENIAEEISQLLENVVYRERTLKNLEAVKEKLGLTGGSLIAAKELVELLS